MRKRRNYIFLIWVLAIVLFIILLIIFIVTLGQVDILDKESALDNETFEEKKNKALAQRNILLKQIELKEGLKAQLDRNFKILYFVVRLILIGTYISYNYFILHLVLDANTVDEFVNYNEISLAIIFILSFLFTGTVADCKIAVSYIKIELENLIYNEYATDLNSLADDRLELKKMNEEIAITYEQRTL
jgi:hypothetical protein